MKDDFNFEHTLGLLAQSFENKEYYKGFEPLNELVRHPRHKDVIPAVAGALDYLADRMDPMQFLDRLSAMLVTLKRARPGPERRLQKTILRQWAETLYDYKVESPDNAFQYLTLMNRNIEAGHPAKALAFSEWNKLAKSSSTNDYIRESVLELGEVKNPDFRLAVLKQLAARQSEKPDEVLEALNKLINESVFGGFHKNDAASAKLFMQTMAKILQKRESHYGPQKTQHIAWEILVWGESVDVDSAKTAAGIYMNAIQKFVEPGLAFDCYRGVIGQSRKNPLLSAEAEIAAGKILDLVEAGKLDNYRYGFDRVAKRLLEDIILPAGMPEALKDRAAEVLFSLTSVELSRADEKSYSTYNNALILLDALPAGDPRINEIVPQWKEGLENNHKEKNAQFYARQMGALLDIATRKGNEGLARYAQTEWKAGIEILMAKNAREACEFVRKECVMQEKNATLQSLATAVLPELEKRTDIQSEPKPVDSAEFLKRFGNGKDGPTP